MRTALDFAHALSPFNELRVVKDLMEPFARAGFHPPCDIEENEQHFRITFDIPGVSKQDVNIELHENELLISGERREKPKPPEEKSAYLFAERTLGKFQRVFTLPTPVNSEAVEARFEDGVLQIILPKAESAKPRRVLIS